MQSMQGLRAGSGHGINATSSKAMSCFSKFTVLIIHDCIPVFGFDLLPDCCCSCCIFPSLNARLVPLCFTVLRVALWYL